MLDGRLKIVQERQNSKLTENGVLRGIARGSPR